MGETSRELTTLPSADTTVEVAFVGRIKHAALYRASMRLGSQSALAKALNVSGSTISSWVNLQSVPAYTDELDGLLILATGKSWYELWPPKLRERIADSSRSDLTNQRAFFRQLRIEEVVARKEALAIEGPSEADALALSARIGQVLTTLSLREQEIIRLRFGLDGRQTHTYEEAAALFKVTRERIRQIEFKAIDKLQRSGVAKLLAGFLPPEEGQDVVDQRPRTKSLKERYE